MSSFIVEGKDLDGNLIWVKNVEYTTYSKEIISLSFTKDYDDAFKTSVADAIDIVKIVREKNKKYGWSVVDINLNIF